MPVSRQHRREVARTAVKKYMTKNRARYAHLSRKERRAKELAMLVRVLAETPKAEFEQHLIEQPRLIVPEVEVQAEGVPTFAGERRSPGGIILL